MIDEYDAPEPRRHRTVTIQPVVACDHDHDTRVPFWAGWGYRVAAAVLAASITAFVAYRSLNADWVDATRRIDGIELRQKATETRLDANDNRFTTLVTKGEFETWSRAQSESNREIKEELIRLRTALERRP